MAAILIAGTSAFDSGTSALIIGLRIAKSAVLISVAWILFSRRPRDPLAALFGISFLLWTISSSGDFAAADQFNWKLLVDRLRFLPFALGLLLFPEGQWHPRRTGPIAAAIVGVFAVGLIEAAGLSSTRTYLPLAIACVMAALASLLARFRALPEIGQQQLKWITLGLVLGIGLILSARVGASFTTSRSIPMSWTILIEGLFQLGIVVIALGFLTSLLRYRLYDAEAAISRSAIYAALTLALVGTFAACEALIELLGQQYFGANIGSVSGAVAAAIAAAMLAPLHGRISNWAEAYFQPDLALLKRELPDLLTALSATASIKHLAAAVLPRIEQAVQSTRSALMVDHRLVAAQGISLVATRKLLKDWQPPDTPKPIGRNDEDAFPLHMALRCPLGSVRGWLLLGPRPDGSFYGRDEIGALTEIAPSLQRALFQVAEREKEAKRHSADNRELRRAFRLVSARLSALEQKTLLQGAPLKPEAL